MSKAYRYGRTTIKHHHSILLGLAILLAICGVASYIIWRDIKSNSNATIEGATRIVGQVTGNTANQNGLKIAEPLFTMQLPVDWKEVERKNNSVEQSITWQSTKKGYDARWLKIYIDKVPATLPVNRLLPVTVSNNTLSAGDISENCATFTQGGTLDAQKATALKPTPAKWQGVDFICNLPSVVDNQVGIAAVGGVNQITVTGQSKGTHKYFFLYTERNIQPDYTYATEAMETFRAL